MNASALESKSIRADLWLQVKAEHPWRVRAYGKPLWIALILHPFHIRFKGGIIHIKEVLK